MRDVYSHIEQHLETSLAELARLCEMPSVSAEGSVIRETAEFVAEMLAGDGFQSQVLPKRQGGNPVVYAGLTSASPLTLLFYNHYDVQPAEPVDLWSSPPFELTRRDDKLYARGVADNKGNIISRLAAVRAFRAVRGEVPVNIKFCLEGDEEIGSPGFGPFVLENKETLRADACIWEGGSVDWQGVPTVYLGAKGLLYVQLDAQGASRDVHSAWGTVVPNPAWRLAWALSSLKSADEKVLVEGFYEHVLQPSPEEMAALAALPSEEDENLRSLGLDGFIGGVRGLDYHRRHVFEPTCTIDGLSAGYQGPGAKTVLPATASAKLDFRLVPDQDPDDILTKLRRHLDRHGFGDVAVTYLSGERPARTPMTSPFVRTVCDAAEEVYGRRPYVTPNMAATGPMYHFIHDLGLPTASAGVGYPDSRAHAPNENIRIDDFIRGMKHIAAIIDRLGRGGVTGES